MKKFLLLFSFITLLISCNKDRETDDLQWKFSVETDNRNIQLGLDVGQEVNLKYVIKKEYSEGAKMTYQIVTSKSNFSMLNGKGESINLNEKYTLEGDTLKLKYQGLEQGEQKLKVIFKNSKGYQVDKELTFNFDDFGFSFKQLDNEVNIGNYLELDYILSFYKNKKAFYSIKILKNDPEGYFQLSKGGSVIAKNVGDEFEILNINEDNKNLINGTLYYYTENPTKGSNRKDEIILEIQAKNSSEKKRISIRTKFLKPNFSVNVEQADPSSLEYIIKINDVKKENNTYYLQDIAFTNIDSKEIKILYKERLYDITEPIKFEGIGGHIIKIILPDEFEPAKSNFSFKIGYLNDKFLSDNKVIEIDFRNVWQHPKFTFISNYRRIDQYLDKSLDKILLTVQLDNVKVSKGTDLNDYEIKIIFKSDLANLEEGLLNEWNLSKGELSSIRELTFFYVTGSPFTIYNYWIYYTFTMDIELYYKGKKIYYKKHIRAQNFSNKNLQISNNDFTKV